eukprot:7437737-Pyramimonas_sp.AAC.1
MQEARVCSHDGPIRRRKRASPALRCSSRCASPMSYCSSWCASPMSYCSSSPGRYFSDHSNMSMDGTSCTYISYQIARLNTDI